MVAKYFINGGNTSSALNWSLSSGGPNDTGVPTLSDDITFNQTVTATVDTVLTCNNLTYTPVNSINVNANIDIYGTLTQSGSGNWTNSTGVVRCRGNVSISGSGCTAKFEFIGDDTTLTLGTNMRIGLPTLNKNVGKKLTITQTANLNSSSSDWIIQEGILDLGAFNLSGSGDFTQNGGAVISSTGILDQERFFLNNGTFDPFKAISSTTSASTLFTDSATLILMPSGGDFEFKYGNHWSINQLYTVFPHMILNKCPTCNQGGQFYCQDLTLLNNSKLGNCFIRGDVSGGGFADSTGAVTFDGVSNQSVSGSIYFGELRINKVTGTLTFNNDFRLYKLNVVNKGDGVDFTTTEAHVYNPSNHGSTWITDGVEFWDLRYTIAYSGIGNLPNTVVLNDFNLDKTGSLGGQLTVGGNVYINDASVSGTYTMLLDGTGDQGVLIAGTSNDGFNKAWNINKPSGIVKLLSDMISTDTGSFLHVIAGLLCTNGFDLTVRNLTVDSGAVIQKVSPTILTVAGTTINNGAILDVTGCGTGVVV